MPKNEAKNTKVENPALEIVEQEQEKAIALRENAKEILGESYDYEDQITKLRVERETTDKHAAAAVYGTLLMGKRLAVMKELEAPNKLTAGCKSAGINPVRASEAIRLYNEYGERPNPLLADAGSEKMLMLLRLPDEIKDEAMESGMLGGDELSRIPRRKMQEMLREFKVDKERGVEQVAELEDAVAEQQRKINEYESGRRNVDDTQFAAEISEMDKKLGEIDFAVTTAPLEDMSDAVLMKLAALLNGMRDQATLIEHNVNLRTGFYDKLQNAPTGTEVQLAQANVAKSKEASN